MPPDETTQVNAKSEPEPRTVLRFTQLKEFKTEGWPLGPGLPQRCSLVIRLPQKIAERQCRTGRFRPGTIMALAETGVGSWEEPGRKNLAGRPFQPARRWVSTWSCLRFSAKSRARKALQIESDTSP